MATISSILNDAATLSVSEQLALNKALCELIRRSRNVNAVVQGAQFQVGDIVKFDAKRRGMKHLKVEKFNRAGTAVVGYECTANGMPVAGAPRWTVSNNVCTKIA